MKARPLAERRETIPVGALAPLSAPGWVEAGLNLVAGLRAATDAINDAGGLDGKRLELLIRDTAADPARALAATDELAGLGVCALVGEYHSVVASAVASRAHALRLPFLCSSAVMDALADVETDWVARIAPTQSRGWRFFAGHLAHAGHRRVALLLQESRYWKAGAKILEEMFRADGGETILIDASMGTAATTEALRAAGTTCAVLLTGFPAPAIGLVRALRRDPRLSGIHLAAPAGQPELPSWLDQLGVAGAGIPFLRYRPDRLTELGERVEGELAMQGSLSFVALEGYDTMLALAAIIRASGTDRSAIALGFGRCEITGTRGNIRFSRVAGVPVWQWAWPGIQIVERDVSEPRSFRVLASLSGS